MTISAPVFDLKFAADDDDLKAAQRLRYRVFVGELGSDGAHIDHAAQREADRFDAHADHLLLRDLARPSDDQVVGVYRLMTRAQADAAGGFSSASEYDLAPLLNAGRPLLELGRSCVHPSYRGGAAVHHLWQGLATHIGRIGTQILFGVASFPGTTPPLQALSYLHDQHLAPHALRPCARDAGRVAMDRQPFDPASRKAAVTAIPPLIKAYLRLGGVVGDGAFVDRDFNTVDVCMVVDVDAMPPALRARYTGDPA